MTITYQILLFPAQFRREIYSHNPLKDADSCEIFFLNGQDWDKLKPSQKCPKDVKKWLTLKFVRNYGKSFSSTCHLTSEYLTFQKSHKMPPPTIEIANLCIYIFYFLWQKKMFKYFWTFTSPSIFEREIEFDIFSASFCAAQRTKSSDIVFLIFRLFSWVENQDHICSPFFPKHRKNYACFPVSLLIVW